MWVFAFVFYEYLCLAANNRSFHNVECESIIYGWWMPFDCQFFNTFEVRTCFPMLRIWNDRFYHCHGVSTLTRKKLLLSNSMKQRKIVSIAAKNIFQISLFSLIHDKGWKRICDKQITQRKYVHCRESQAIMRNAWKSQHELLSIIHIWIVAKECMQFAFPDETKNQYQS